MLALDPNNEDERLAKSKALEQMAQTPGALPASTGGSGAVGGSLDSGGGKMTTGPAAAAPQGSGNYFNLSKFIDLNRDQAGGLANKIAGGVGADAAKAMDQFRGLQADANVAVGKAQQDRMTRGNEYAGPTSLQGFDPARYGQLQSAVNTAASGVDKLGASGGVKSDAGRQALLQQQLGTPTYTTGQRQYDSLLLGASPGATQQVADTRNQYANLRGMLEQGNNALAGAGNVPAGQGNQWPGQTSPPVTPGAGGGPIAQPPATTPAQKEAGAPANTDMSPDEQQNPNQAQQSAAAIARAKALTAAKTKTKGNTTYKNSGLY